MSTQDQIKVEHFPEEPWLHRIYCSVVHPSTDPPVTSECHALLIEREVVRRSFHKSLKNISPCVRLVSGTVFDNFGRIRDKYLNHDIHKGNEAWGRELNRGNLLVIEFISVRKPFRRFGTGTQLVKAVLRVATQYSDLFYAFTRPMFLQEEVESKTLTHQGVVRVAVDQEKRAVSFFRDLGFRRIGCTRLFCYASDQGHPSHNIPASQDFDPPPHVHAPMSSPVPSCLHHSVTINWDQGEVTVAFFNERMRTHGTNHPSWLEVDADGNNILHLAALFGNYQTVSWISRRAFYQELAAALNCDYQTPREALEENLDNRRTGIADKTPFSPTPTPPELFTESSHGQSHALLMLNNMKLPTMLALNRVECGCTCGHCLSGTMSPRMEVTLFQAAIELHGMVADELRDAGLENENEREAAAPPSIIRMMKEKPMAWKGYLKVLSIFAEIVKKGRTIPTRQLVAKKMSGDECKAFSDAGGDVNAVVQGVFEQAVREDNLIGEMSVRGKSDEMFEKLPTCRNDHEYGFVARRSGYRFKI